MFSPQRHKVHRVQIRYLPPPYSSISSPLLQSEGHPEKPTLINVTLRKGEAGMPKKCVINVTQVKSVDKQALIEEIGRLSDKRMEEVIDGLKLVLDIV